MTFKFGKSATSEMRPEYVQNEDGTISMILPSRPEPVRATPTRVDEGWVRKRLGWSAETFEATVTGGGFPVCTRDQNGRRYWLDAEIERWIADTRAKAAALAALVAKA